MRLVFNFNDQIRFFREVKQKSGKSSKELGKLIGISGRSLNDWINGKICPVKKSMIVLGERFGVELPEILEEREEFWSGRVNGRKAALKRLEIYGPPGTEEGRKKGGLVSQRRRRERPKYYKNLGCVVRNEFKKPRKSSKLAEFVGVVLGDGCLSEGQCRIFLSLKDDRLYAKYIKGLIFDLFGYEVSMLEYFDRSTIELTVTGVSFVEMMKNLDLKVGNKVKQQVRVPDWIRNKKSYLRACVRGLFDTDGGTFFHKHWVGDYYYRHFGLTFTSASECLLGDFKNCLKTDGILTHGKKDCLFVYKGSDIKKFFETYEPRNLKHKNRHEEYLNKPSRLN